jgi:hypothetical protein
MYKIRRKIRLCIIITSLSSCFSFSQTPQSSDPYFQTLGDEEFKELWDQTKSKIPLLENMVFKNIFLYRLNLIPNIKDISDLTFFKTNNTIIDSLLPNYDTKVDILITPLNDLYREQYICLSVAFSEESSSYNTYTFYNRFFPYNNNFLIAFNPYTNDIDFLSGDFYKTRIRIRYHGENIYKECQTNTDDCIVLKQELHDYIHFRLYQFRIKSIREEGMDENSIYYSAYSEDLAQRVKVKINLKSFKKVNNDLEYDGNIDMLFNKNNLKYIFPLKINPKSYEEIRIYPIE